MTSSQLNPWNWRTQDELSRITGFSAEKSSPYLGARKFLRTGGQASPKSRRKVGKSENFQIQALVDRRLLQESIFQLASFLADPNAGKFDVGKMGSNGDNLLLVW